MPEEARGGRRIVWVLALAGIIVALVQTIVAPLLPSVPGFLDTTPGAASWMVTVTLMSGCMANPILGRLGDLYGKRRMILLGLVLLIIGSLVCATAGGIAAMLVGRALQGAALALTPLAMSILRDQLPRHQVPGGIAVVSATIGTGAAIGYPVAGLTIQFANWHTMFWVTAATALVVLLMILVWVPEDAPPRGGRFDVAGSVTLCGALFLLLFGLERSARWGWWSWEVAGCLAGAAAIGGCFVLLQSRTRVPLVDVRSARRAPILLTHLVAGAVGFGFYANALAVAQLVQEPRETGYGLGYGVLVGGLVVLPGGIAMLLLSSASARLARRFGPAPVVQAGCAVMAVGYGLHVLFAGSGGLVGLVGASSVVSSGAALSYSALTLLLMSVVPIAETGAANGLNTLVRILGQAACSAVTASVLGTFTVEIAGGVLRPDLVAYQVVFLTAGGCCVVAIGLAGAAARARRRTPTGEPASAALVDAHRQDTR